MLHIQLNLNDIKLNSNSEIYISINKLFVCKQNCERKGIKRIGNSKLGIMCVVKLWRRRVPRLNEKLEKDSQN